MRGKYGHCVVCLTHDLYIFNPAAAPLIMLRCAVHHSLLRPPLHQQFSFNYVAEDPRNSLKLLFRRRTDVMPPPPKVGEACV